MLKHSPHNPTQLGFDAMLDEAEHRNAARRVEHETAHLPDTMEDAVPVLHALIDRHHAAMLAGDEATVMALRKEAELLAVHLNGGAPDILAGDDAPGCVLMRRTAARPGEVPLWGQSGEFEIKVGTMRVRVEFDGIIGIGSLVFWLGFDAYAVEEDKLFLSKTGFRSFLGVFAETVPGLAPDAFARKAIEDFVERECKGKLVAIDPEFRSGGDWY